MTKGNPEGPFLATARGKSAAHRPLWIMRQAGRYLPEYREMKERHSFLELCKNPEAAAEVTLQPLRRYDLDAAILFTDLLIPIEPMGVGLEYVPGPQLGKQIRSQEDVEALIPLEPEDHLAPMLETVRLVREQLDEDKALIGFVGAPFTMSCYMVEGKGSKSWDATRRLLHESPQVFDALGTALCDNLCPLVAALVEAGCDAIQVFDSWASVLDFEDYSRFGAPGTERLLQTARDCGAVAINYVNGAAQHLEAMIGSCAEVLAIDWRLPMAKARALTPSKRCIQGNMDPTWLFASEAEIRRNVSKICRAAGERHIFNLGHGILPQVDPVTLSWVVEEVHKS